MMNDFSDTRFQAFVKDLETIVNMDSSSGNTQGIRTVAEFFKQRFEALGMTCRLSFESPGKVPCLRAEIGPDKRPYDLMCLGHMDTVFPQGEAARRPFSTDGKTAWGPGVCDMKGGLLVVLYALEMLHRKGCLSERSICVCFNGDEETGSTASRDLIESCARKSRRVLVFEPCRPGYKVVLQRKGGGWFYVRARGRSAHAGADPEKGVNAVVELAVQISRIQTLNNPDTGTSAQVTVVKGGDKINIIPDRAEAAVDVRISKRAEKERVEAFFKTLKPCLEGAEIQVSGSIDRPPMEHGPGAERLFARIRDHARALGIPAGGIHTGGCSDGNFTAALGVPTIDGMGIVGANAHREDEYVELDSVRPMVLLLTRLVERDLAPGAL